MLLLLAAGCGVTGVRRGVSNEWRAPDAVSFTVGETTERQVMEALGPPSQVIALGDRTVLYYILEETETSDLRLVLYNRSDTKVRYDRAVYFFDAGGVLTDQSVSRERVGYEPSGEEE